MIHHKNQHLVSKGFWGEKVSILQPTFMTTKFYSTVMFAGFYCYIMNISNLWDIFYSTVLFTWFCWWNPSHNSMVFLLVKSPEVWTNSALSFCFFTSGSADVSTLDRWKETRGPKVEDGTWKWWFLKKWIHPGNYMGLCLSYKYDILDRYITYIYIYFSFYGVYFQVPCHFFWEGRMCRWVHLLHKKIWPAQRSQISPQKRHHLRMWHSKNPSSPPRNGIPSFWVAFGHPMLHILKTEGHPLGFLLYYYSFAIQHEGGVVLLIAHAGYKTSLQKPKWNHFRHHKSWLMHYHFIIYENK